MTKVLIHGNPETDAIWGPLVACLVEGGLDDRVVRLSPPGFGAPVPEGWEPDRAGYVAWLVGELEALGSDGPVDVVGHDWGAGHVFGLLDERPGLVRSWAADCVGLLHPGYVWHDLAQVWQTPDAGEEAVAAQAAMGVDGRVEAYRPLGLGPDITRSLAEAFDDDMGRCILTLYRSAMPPVLADASARLTRAASGDALPPGLVIDPTDDPYVSSELGSQMVDPLGARHLRLSGRGHWWMVEDPEQAADGLLRFWADVAAGS